MYSHGCHRDREPIVARPSTRATLSVALRGLRAAAMAVLLVSLAACSVFSDSHESPGSAAMLRSNLSVASAALAAGQPAVAHKLYLSLAERFDAAPEPVLGLGYVALQANDLDAANDYFLNAAELAYETPAIRAEALLGAGRIALAQGDTPRAREYLGEARDLEQGAPSAMWIENGLAVAAALDKDYETAEAHYTEALKRSTGHPQIVANLVRMLIASGRVEEAAQRYDERNPSYWEEHDERALPLLIEEARAQQSLQRLNPDLLLHWSSFESLPLPPRDGAKTAGSIELAGVLGLALRLADESSLVMSLVAEAPHAASIPTPAALPSAPSGLPPAYPLQLPSAATLMKGDIEEPMSEADEDESLPPSGFAVVLGQSRQWQLDGEAQAVATAAPEVADVQLLSPNVLYVIGKSVGRTSVAVLSDDGSVWMQDVSVVLDLEPLHALLAREPDLSDVRARSISRGVALTGEVDSSVADRALRLATASLPEGTWIENDMKVAPQDLEPLRELLAYESDMQEVHVRKVARGIALTGIVGSIATAERASRLAVASMPETMLVENNLRVEPDPEPLRALLAEEPEFRDVSVQRLARGVALAGEVDSAATADRVLRLAAASLPEETLIENNVRITGPQQVNLEVQIAEVHRSISEDLGLNWKVFGIDTNSGAGFGFQVGRDAFGPSPNGTLSLVPTSVDGVPSPILGLLETGTWDDLIFTSITGVVDALAKAGMANVLARPNVTAISGETASFFSGGEYPLPTGYKDGTVTYSYRKYGVLLDFIPTIIDNGRIELKVRPEVSEPSRDNSIQIVTGVNIPVINVRRAETTIEVADGESIVIAGLFRSASNDVQSGVPVLKDLPLFGGLFGHSSTRSDEIELIVTVTARLVQSGPAPDSTSVATAPSRANNYYY